MKGVSPDVIPEMKAWRPAKSKDELAERLKNGEPVRCDTGLVVFKLVNGELYSLTTLDNEGKKVAPFFTRHYSQAVKDLFESSDIWQVLDDQSIDCCKLSNACRLNTLHFEVPPWIEIKKFDPLMCKNCNAFVQIGIPNFGKRN